MLSLIWASAIQAGDGSLEVEDTVDAVRLDDASAERLNDYTGVVRLEA